MSRVGYMLNEAGIEARDFDIISDKSNNRVTGKAILQTGNEKNRNGRIYRTEDLAREITAPRQVELLSTGNLLSRMGHPLSNELIVQQTIDPRDCCARFLKLWMEGDNVMGTFQGTNNDLGETFDKDLRMGVKPAFSLRALGTITATPQGAVVENLKMITYDYVIYPSHPGAYTLGLVSESASLLDDPTSNFEMNAERDATKSFIKEFTREDVLDAIDKSSLVKESAIDFIKDKSYNFHLLKEAFEMTNFNTVDFINDHQVALTEAGNATIVMNIEDYIVKELQNYRG